MPVVGFERTLCLESVFWGLLPLGDAVKGSRGAEGLQSAGDGGHIPALTAHCVILFLKDLQLARRLQGLRRGSISWGTPPGSSHCDPTPGTVPQGPWAPPPDTFIPLILLGTLRDPQYVETPLHGPPTWDPFLQYPSRGPPPWEPTPGVPNKSPSDTSQGGGPTPCLTLAPLRLLWVPTYNHPSTHSLECHLPRGPL